MPLKQLPSDLPIHTFSSPNQFEAFLEREHIGGPGCYIKLAKKASGIPSITAPEAVVVCLCFGWIDGGGGGTIDETWWLTRYTPRRPKSIWSKKNTDTVERLTQEGRMRPAGIVAVEAAKADGRWARAYDGPAAITVPDDLAAVLAAEPMASAFFNGLSKSDRYAVLHRVQVASLKTRATRIEALVQMLSAGNVPGKVVKPQIVAKRATSMRKTGGSIAAARVSKTATKKTDVRQSVTTEHTSNTKSTIAPNGSRRPGLRSRG